MTNTLTFGLLGLQIFDILMIHLLEDLAAISWSPSLIYVLQELTCFTWLKQQTKTILWNVNKNCSIYHEIFHLSITAASVSTTKYKFIERISPLVSQSSGVWWWCRSFSELVSCSRPWCVVAPAMNMNHWTLWDEFMISCSYTRFRHSLQWLSQSGEYDHRYNDKIRRANNESYFEIYQIW